MTTLTVELPPDLLRRLDSVAGSIPGEKDRLVQEALEERRVSGTVRKADRGLNLQPFPDGKTFGDLTKDVCGMFEGPGDLSTNPKYLEGLGEE